MIHSILADSKNDGLEQRHGPERMPTPVLLAKQVVSGSVVVDLIACGHDYAGAFEPWGA